MKPGDKARQLRRLATRAEQLLWLTLRNRALDGFKFRRQHPVDPYIADFACPAQNLIVELDGPSHDLDYRRDQRRDAWLASLGSRVLRIPNEEVTGNLDGAVATILVALRERGG
jgi:very-short-patch-repair endonuclease